MVTAHFAFVIRKNLLKCREETSSVQMTVTAAKLVRWSSHRVVFFNNTKIWVLNGVTYILNRYNQQSLIMQEVTAACTGSTGVFHSHNAIAVCSEIYYTRKQELWNSCFFRGWRKWQLMEQMQRGSRQIFNIDSLHSSCVIKAQLDDGSCPMENGTSVSRI